MQKSNNSQCHAERNADALKHLARCFALLLTHHAIANAQHDNQEFLQEISMSDAHNQGKDENPSPLARDSCLLTSIFKLAAHELRTQQKNENQPPLTPDF